MPCMPSRLKLTHQWETATSAAANSPTHFPPISRPSSQTATMRPVPNSAVTSRREPALTPNHLNERAIKYRK